MSLRFTLSGILSYDDLFSCLLRVEFLQYFATFIETLLKRILNSIKTLGII